MFRFRPAANPDFRQMMSVWIACLLAGIFSVAAAEPWADELKQFAEQDRQKPPSPDAVLFVGSSSIRLWDLDRWFPGRATLNRGFGGSTVPDVVRDYDRLVLRYKPATIVFYSGDNDIAGGRSAEQVAADFAVLLKKIRADLPQTRVIFLPTKPSLARWKLVDIQRDANHRIRALAADDPLLIYVDICAPMLNADGRPRPELFQADGLHLNDEGYRLWTSLVAPLLEAKTEK